MPATLLAVIGAVVLVAAIALWTLVRRRRSRPPSE
jgi:LPXTG-motif cell wall-anchored protein